MPISVACLMLRDARCCCRERRFDYDALPNTTRAMRRCADICCRAITLLTCDYLSRVPCCHYAISFISLAYAIFVLLRRHYDAAAAAA